MSELDKIIRCDFSNIYTSETLKIVNEISKVICCMDLYYSKKRFDHRLFLNLKENIKNVCDYWTGNVYIGTCKENNVKNTFQVFFEKLMKLLLYMKNSEIKYEKEYANEVLYQGKLYRYLSSDKFSAKSVDVEYSNVYVSWSKQKENNVKGKMYYPYKILTCEMSKEMYGIDIEAIGVSKYLEFEFVFPTIKETIINVEEVFDNYKEDEDE